MGVLSAVVGLLPDGGCARGSAQGHLAVDQERSRVHRAVSRLDPINVRMGNRSLFEFTRRRDWRPVVALWVGCLICGFFWELWNFWSYPRWVYDVPFVGVLKVFEMPLLGYGGYLPFALELFALYHLMLGLLGRGRWDYVQPE